MLVILLKGIRLACAEAFKFIYPTVKAHNHKVMGFLFLFIIMVASLDIGHP